MKKVLLICCLLIVPLTGSQSPRTEADDRVTRVSAASGGVSVRPINGAAVNGRLTSFDAQSLSLRDGNGTPRSWRLSELRSLHVSPVPRAVVESPPVLLLANDDILPGTVQSADEETLTLQWIAVDPPQSVTVPLESVRSFAFQQPEDELDQIFLRRIWALMEPTADRLISTDKTHVDGELFRLAEGKVQFKSSLGMFTAPVNEVIAVIMNSELRSPPEREGPYLLVSLRDGSRISFASLQWTDGTLSGLTVWGAELSFPLKRVARVQFLGDRVIPLTDLTTASYVFTPYLTHKYPLVANRNVKGGRLRLRGHTYAIGLGVSSKSEVTYDLSGGGYTGFEAIVGVDDMTGGQGNVVFAVELDGKRVYQSEALGGRNPAETIGPLNVSGADKLKLIVDFGRFGNIQDVADWCDPVLIKSSAGQ